MIRILHIDDSDSDLRLTRRAFRHIGDVCFTEAKDGEEGLDQALRVSPDIILLDMNLPRLRGDEVLRVLRSLEKTRRIPIVILTSSDDHEEVARVYGLTANAYITKPVTLAKFKEVADAVDLIWSKRKE